MRFCCKTYTLLHLLLHLIYNHIDICVYILKRHDRTLRFRGLHVRFHGGSKEENNNTNNNNSSLV